MCKMQQMITDSRSDSAITPSDVCGETPINSLHSLHTFWPLLMWAYRRSFLQITYFESSQQADLLCRLLTADNQTALMGEGSHLDQISTKHLRDKRAAAANRPEECQLGEIFSACNYWWNISDRHPSCCWVTARRYQELFLGLICFACTRFLQTFRIWNLKRYYVRGIEKESLDGGLCRV